MFFTLKCSKCVLLKWSNDVAQSLKSYSKQGRFPYFLSFAVKIWDFLFISDMCSYQYEKFSSVMAYYAKHWQSTPTITQRITAPYRKAMALNLGCRSDPINSQMTPHFSPWWTSCGVDFVSFCCCCSCCCCFVLFWENDRSTVTMRSRTNEIRSIIWWYYGKKFYHFLAL